MKTEAIFSDSHLYRYLLRRIWDDKLIHMLFIMLNPSMADDEKDDPTIRRCIGFAKREGFGGIEVVNLLAMVSTIPFDARARSDRYIGIDNDQHIHDAVQRVKHAGRIVVAWGATAPAWRVKQMHFFLKDLNVYCLGTTANGMPRHPLYVRANQPMVEWGGL